MRNVIRLDFDVTQFSDSFQGLTGHTEVVRVVFSPDRIRLEELLKRFWEGHNPTQGMARILSKLPEVALELGPSRGAGGVLEQKDDAQTCAVVVVVVVVLEEEEEGRSHGCKSMPDSVNVSEIQPSMERHTSAVHVRAPAAGDPFFMSATLRRSF